MGLETDGGEDARQIVATEEGAGGESDGFGVLVERERVTCDAIQGVLLRQSARERRWKRETLS